MAGSLGAKPAKCKKPRCVTGSHTTSPVTPAAAGSLVAPSGILSESAFASRAARSSAAVGGGGGVGGTGGGTITEGVVCTTAGASGGGVRSQPKIASTKHAAAANQP